MGTSSIFRGKGGRRNLIAALSSLALFSFFDKKLRQRPPAPREGPIDCGAGARKTAKMLTQDGRLVEVDLDMSRSVRKVTKEELRDWINSHKD